MKTQRVSRIHWGLNVAQSLTGVVVKDVNPVSIELDCSNCNVHTDLINDSVKPDDNWTFYILASCRRCKFTYFVKACFDEKQHNIDFKDDKGRFLDEFTITGNILDIYPPVKEMVVPTEIPAKYGVDFLEAKLVLDISPKSSAALSRRVLQHFIREELDKRKIVLKKNPSLMDEVQAFVDIKEIPSYITEQLDAVRLIGNLAAHATAATQPDYLGTIVDVEPGEAEWLILILDSLFDFFFVVPEKTKERIKKFNEKMKKTKGKEPDFKVPQNN